MRFLVLSRAFRLARSRRMKRSRTKGGKNGWAAKGRAHRLYRLLIVRLRAIISSENGHFHAEGSNYPPLARKLLLLDGQIPRWPRKGRVHGRGRWNVDDGCCIRESRTLSRRLQIYKLLIGANAPWRMITCNDFMSEK